MTPNAPAVSPTRPLYFEAADEGRDKVRAAVVAVEREMALVAAGGKPSSSGLKDSWAGLVQLLSSEPAHQVRGCPLCGHVGMSAATRCHHCWEKLTPPQASEAHTAPAPGATAQG